jgi:methyl-accepting chemotaxis protein
VDRSREPLTCLENGPLSGSRSGLRRAGRRERGGFAVVAEEVRKPAERTRENLTSIADLDTTSVRSVEGVASALRDAAGAVGTVETEADVAHAHLDATLAAIESVNHVVREIAEDVSSVAQTATDAITHRA